MVRKRYCPPEYYPLVYLVLKCTFLIFLIFCFFPLSAVVVNKDVKWLPALLIPLASQKPSNSPSESKFQLLTAHLPAEKMLYALHSLSLLPLPSK